VVSAESLVTILAFRGGTLAKAGHNHVIASHDVTGTIYIPAETLHSTFELRIPVLQLTIDEAQLRAQEGPDFPLEVPDTAKEGTRRNMLSEALLNGARYPDVTLEGEGLQRGGEASRDAGEAQQGAGEAVKGAGDTSIVAGVRITVRDQPHTILVPARYELTSGQVIVSGEMPVRQSDLGLVPFSALLGALQVQNELHVRFRIVARAAQTKGAGAS